MKKLFSAVLLSFVCFSFAMAQTGNASKAATLLTDGTQIKDVKTGEVIRISGGTVDVPQLQTVPRMTMTKSGGQPTDNGNTNGKVINQKVQPEDSNLKQITPSTIQRNAAAPVKQANTTKPVVKEKESLELKSNNKPSPKNRISAAEAKEQERQKQILLQNLSTKEKEKLD